VHRPCVPGVEAGARRAAALAAAASVALALAAPAAARAGDCPGDAGPLATLPVEQRIASVRSLLDAERPGAEAWTWAWGATNAALAVGQLVSIPLTSSTDMKIVRAAGALTSAGALLRIVLAPIAPPPEPAGSPAEEPCQVLARLERALEQAARNEALGTGLPAQLGNLLVNLAFGVAVGLASRDLVPAAITFGVGWSIGEAQILSQPRALVAGLERYRAGDLGPAGAPPGLGVGRGGGAWTLSFHGTF